MSIRRIAALLAGLLAVSMFGHAATKNALRIKVLDSETKAVDVGGNDVPNNCEQVTFDAYCRASRSTPMKSTLLVQIENEPPFRISCTMESKFSRCTPLAIGESYDARKEKHGITVYYVDDKGKARSELYKLETPEAKAGAPVPTTVVASQPAPAPHSAAPVQSSPSPSPAPPAAARQRGLEKAPAQNVEKVRCNFTSTPPDADITVDGHYVGNTPSEISLSAGTHVVVIAKVGFAEWKRELTVAADSVVNVSASLQTQP